MPFQKMRNTHALRPFMKNVLFVYERIFPISDNLHVHGGLDFGVLELNMERILRWLIFVILLAS